MNLSIIFRVVNIIVAAFMIIGGVMTCIAGGFPNFIQGIFVIIFGLMTMLFEFRLPAMITQFASFMFSFMGRGICKDQKKVTISFSVLVLVFGVIFVVLHFFKNRIDAPSNMTKRAFEDAVGYNSSSNTTQVNDPNHPVPSNNYPTNGFSAAQSPYTTNASPYAPNPTYPPANYANPGTV
ncbi:MAG: COPI associated protein-domain-containing protein [Benjaminiella poitrasii]|nr:MAG: COPI associated protein-domain-containing protein [Benjaminiella poitrasii]